MVAEGPPRLVVFDLDDTLCDHEAGRQRAYAAVNEVLRESGIARAAFWDRHQAARSLLLTALAAHRIDIGTYERERFENTIPDVIPDRAALAARLRNLYSAALVETVTWYPNARSVLTRISAWSRIAVLTNGTSALQRAKLAQLRLPASAMPAVFISEETGLSKPDPRAFELVLDRCAVRARDAAMIGDSIEKDLLPSLDVGMRAIMVAHGRAVPATCPVPTVSELSDLLELFRV